MSKVLDLVRKPKPVGQGHVQAALGFSILCVAIGIPLGISQVYEYKAQDRKHVVNPKTELIHDEVFKKMQARREGKIRPSEEVAIAMIGTHRSPANRMMDEATAKLVEEAALVPVGSKAAMGAQPEDAADKCCAAE
jgi:hypothetical protein